MKGFGDAAVLEVIAQHDGDTFRGVYTVHFGEVVYVLHVFQKKVEARHRYAEERAGADPQRAEARRAGPQTMERARRTGMSTDETIIQGVGNVFDDLGMPDAAAELVKAQLTFQIAKRIKALGLTQTAAAARLGISQPDVSRLMKRRPTGFSTDRLLALLTALDIDVDIVLRPASAPAHTAKVSIREELP
jgi:predicted XRE-type DNA-binding protein